MVVIAFDTTLLPTKKVSLLKHLRCANNSYFSIVFYHSRWHFYPRNTTTHTSLHTYTTAREALPPPAYNKMSTPQKIPETPTRANGAQREDIKPDLAAIDTGSGAADADPNSPETDRSIALNDLYAQVAELRSIVADQNAKIATQSWLRAERCAVNAKEVRSFNIRLAKLEKVLAGRDGRYGEQFEAANAVLNKKITSLNTQIDELRAKMEAHDAGDKEQAAKDLRLKARVDRFKQDYADLTNQFPKLQAFKDAGLRADDPQAELGLWITALQTEIEVDRVKLSEVMKENGDWMDEKKKKLKEEVAALLDCMVHLQAVRAAIPDAGGAGVSFPSVGILRDGLANWM